MGKGRLRALGSGRRATRPAVLRERSEPPTRRAAPASSHAARPPRACLGGASGPHAEQACCGAACAPTPCRRRRGPQGTQVQAVRCVGAFRPQSPRLFVSLPGRERPFVRWALPLRAGAVPFSYERGGCSGHGAGYVPGQRLWSPHAGEAWQRFHSNVAQVCIGAVEIVEGKENCSE